MSALFGTAPPQTPAPRPPPDPAQVEARAKAACDRHYAEPLLYGWIRPLRWETVGETERERLRAWARRTA